MAKEKTYTWEILLSGSEEWEVVETTEDKDRLLKHAHIAAVREVGASEVKEIEEVEEVVEQKNTKKK